MTSDSVDPVLAGGLAAAVLRVAGVGVVVTDDAGTVRWANPEVTRLLGWTADQLIGLDLHDTLHSHLHSPGDAGHGCPILAAASGERRFGESDVLIRSDGSLLAVTWVADALPADPHAEVAAAGVVLSFLDATGQHLQSVTDAADRLQDHADLWAARQSVRDLGWIAELTRVMSTTMDERESMLSMARLLTPRLADVVIVDRIDDDGTLQRLGGAVAEGVAIDLAAALEAPGVAHIGPGDPATRATIEMDSVRRLGPVEIADPAVFGTPSRSLLDAIGARSMLLVPLGSRGRLVGLAALIRLRDDAYSDDDMLLAADIGRRAGLVLDNARLYGRQLQMAMDLQMALLPVVSTSPNVIPAARYLPARDRLRIGGDWYDLFVCPLTHAVVMVVGDVAGHDLPAATTMAALRNLLRGTAITAGDGPAAIIDQVDTAMAPLGVHGTATTVIAAAERRNDHWQVTWSSAGHLPIVLIAPDGSAEQIVADPDTLLGTRTHRSRRDHELRVEFGSTVLLYTDGLVERRDEDLEVGLERLRAAAEGTAELAPAALLDHVIDAMAGTQDDDTALLAVRLV